MLRRFILVAAIFSQLSMLQLAQAADKAPETYKVKFETTKGDVVIEVTRKLAPNGADRFHELVTAGFYDDCRFFRVLPGFMVQFGMNGDPKTQAKWQNANIDDDPVKVSNSKGTITFATSGPDSRTSQLFINYANNKFLDGQGFSPFGKVVEGMEIVEKINAEYKEEPNQGKILTQGNEYLNSKFPNLDYIKKATIMKDEK